MSLCWYVMSKTSFMSNGAIVGSLQRVNILQHQFQSAICSSNINNYRYNIWQVTIEGHLCENRKTDISNVSKFEHRPSSYCLNSSVKNSRVINSLVEIELSLRTICICQSYVEIRSKPRESWRSCHWPVRHRFLRIASSFPTGSYLARIHLAEVQSGSQSFR